MTTDPSRSEISEDAVLGGRLRLKQPRRGHRVGHDAILLAAARPAGAGGAGGGLRGGVGGAGPAGAGDAVVDLGAGVGAAGLALATRVGGTAVTLVEIDADLAALAAEN